MHVPDVAPQEAYLVVIRVVRNAWGVPPPSPAVDVAQVATDNVQDTVPVTSVLVATQARPSQLAIPLVSIYMLIGVPSPGPPSPIAILPPSPRALPW